MAARRVGVLGGTFDPVHKGHLHIAAKCREAVDLDLVIFMPCRRSPHKDLAPAASDSDRLRMLELATDDEGWACVSTIELDRPPPSFSWVTAESLHEVFPAAEIYWLMGADQWRVLNQWERPDHLATLVHFVVFHRGEAPAPLPGFVAHFVAGEHPASASLIRSALESGEPPKWLDSGVEHFIAERGLYQCEA